MTSRERLLTAMRRGTPDRIPYTYHATGECAEALRAHLGLNSTEEIDGYFHCDRFGAVADLLGGGHITWNHGGETPDGRRTTLWGTPLKRVEYSTGAYWEFDTPPLARMETAAEIDAYAWPDPDKVEFIPLPEEAVWQPRRAGIVVGEGAFIGPFGIAWQVRGMEALMMDMIADPENVEAIVANIEAFTLPLLARALDLYAGAIDYVSCGDDFGTQLGLLISREHFQRFFAPSLRRHFHLAKSKGVMCYQHCCGAIYDIIPDLIDCGVEVLNPIQVTAEGMDPARLKREFGGHLAFHGAIDIQQTLPTGTPDDVRREVRERIAQLGPDGYVLAPSHALQSDIPPENIVAMYEEVLAVGMAG
ncbi:MAG TPA: uroporphyrinogen decarboxylase family protein [Armatimonadota bacterium]|nr:uroporphyrinogen decarboxylase family protein [Armatimonadota bacterium]